MQKFVYKMFHCFQKVKRNKFQIYPKIGTLQAQRQDFFADTGSLLCGTRSACPFVWRDPDPKFIFRIHI